MIIEILIGQDAEKLIKDREFSRKWIELYQKCRWATVFQSEDFVVTWYKTYKDKYSPVIVFGLNGNRELAGLLSLAVNIRSGELIIAGGREAEYQAWLSDTEDRNAFIEEALHKLSKRFPNRTLTFLFTAPEAPLEWAARKRVWGNRCYIKSHPRGLMTVGDGSAFEETLRKKMQNKVNRLKRLGDLRFDQIQDPEVFESVFDEIMCYRALRLKAVYNVGWADDDPLKKAFFTDLMRLHNILHVSLLRLGDKIVSAQIHVRNKDQVMLGHITHSPLYGKFSPGTLHLLMLGKLLANQSVPIFDLTPGGEYKERYATHHDEVFMIKVFFSRIQYHSYNIKRKLVEIFKAAGLLLNISPEHGRVNFLTLQDKKRKWSAQKLPSMLLAILTRTKRALWHTEELRIYTVNPERVYRLSEPRVMKKDYLPDLLIYQPMDPHQPAVNRFIQVAMEYLESGHHIFTRVDGGSLVQYGWLFVVMKQQSIEINRHNLDLPANSALVVSCLNHVKSGNLSDDTLCQMIREAVETPNVKQVYVCVLSEDRALRKVIEDMGSDYQYSSFRKERFKKVKRWSSVSYASNRLQ